MTPDEIESARRASRMLRRDGLLYVLLEFLARQPRHRADSRTIIYDVAEELGLDVIRTDHRISGLTVVQLWRIDDALALATRRGLVRPEGRRRVPKEQHEDKTGSGVWLPRWVSLTDAGYRALAAEMLEEEGLP